MTRFVFGDRIGSGGFGLVLHATRVDDGLPFAAKQLLPEHAGDEEVLQRFRNEVRMQRSLEHPNVLPIVGANLSASPPWFIMPIAERTLLDEIATRLSDEEVSRVFSGILAGVAHAHEKGVLHRDLKPENVMMSHDNVPQVADFGLGKNLLSDSTSLTRTYLGAGSFPYVAPEQMLSLRDADERADVYGLGKILQSMVTGRLPVLHTDPAVPRNYQYFVSRCTAQRKEDRYQTVAEMIVAFGQVTQGVERPRAAREVADELISEWLQLPEGADLGALRALHEHLERNSGDALLFLGLAPNMPVGLVQQYIEQMANEFARLLAIYDEHVSGSMGFEYCDTVARFYRDIWNLTRDLGIRRIVLERLVQIGPAHNRYFVGDVVAGILKGSGRVGGSHREGSGIVREGSQGAARAPSRTPPPAWRSPSRRVLRCRRGGSRRGG